MTQAIFQSTGQALHVSFLIMSMEVRQESQLRKALIRVIESVDMPSNQLKSWLEQLRGTSSGTVNFSGLSPYEVRAQCAMVTQAARDHLPAPERFAVYVRYGIQRERAEGVIGLAEYVKPQLTFDDDIAIRALVYGHSMPRMRMKGLSYPEIEKERGINARTLRRAAGLIATTTRTLESMAVTRLTPMFEQHGVVEVEDALAIAAA